MNVTQTDLSLFTLLSAVSPSYPLRSVHSYSSDTKRQIINEKQA